MVFQYNKIDLIIRCVRYLYLYLENRKYLLIEKLLKQKIV